MTTIEPQIAAPKPKLRWFQFSLRTLLVVVTFCAVACSWLAVKIQQAKRQEAVVADIRNRGGCIWYDFELVYDPKVGMAFLEPYRAVPPEPTWLRNLWGDDLLATVVGVEMHRNRCKTEPTDADLELISRLPELKLLDIDGPRITDAGLENLKGLSQLKELTLDSTNITDAGLEHIKELHQYLVISVCRTKVTDQGVKRLQQALPNCGIIR